MIPRASQNSGGKRFVVREPITAKSRDAGIDNVVPIRPMHTVSRQYPMPGRIVSPQEVSIGNAPSVLTWCPFG